MANDLKKALIPIVVVLLTVAALGYYFRTQYSGSHSDPAPSITIRVGEQVPDFSVVSLVSGKPVKLSEIRYRTMLIHFWATWCQSCVIEMPQLEKLWTEFHPKGFEMMAVSLDDDPVQDVPRIQKKLKVTFPIFYDPETQLSNIFDIHLIPLSVIVDSNRRILWFESGEGDWDSVEMRAKIKGWLDR